MKGTWWAAVVFTVAVLAGGCSASTAQENGQPIPASPNAQEPVTPTAVQTTDAGTGQLEDPCSTFAIVSTLSSMPGTIPDPSLVEGSVSPTSPEAEEAASLFEEVLSQALGASAATNCYIEGVQGEQTMTWMAIQLSGGVTTDSRGKIEAALSARDVTVNGTFSSSSQGQNITWYLLGGLPVGEGTLDGFLYVLDHNAIVVLSDEGEGEPTETPTPEFTPTPEATAIPSATPTPTMAPELSLTGIAGELDTLLRASLEEALGVKLTVRSSEEFTDGGVTTVSLDYDVIGEGEGDATAVEEVLTFRGATLEGTFSSSEGTVVSFQGLPIDEKGGDGSLQVAGQTLSLILEVAGPEPADTPSP